MSDSSSSISASSSSKLRMTGLSGIDTDGIIKKLMDAENTKLDKLKQDRQTVQWQQDIYRDMMGEINTFISTYYDPLNPDKYMGSINGYNTFDVTSADAASTTAIPSATASANINAIPGTYKLENIVLAKKATSSSGILNLKQADGAIKLPLTIDSTNNTLAVKINGTVTNVSLTNKVYDGTSAGQKISDFVADINTKLYGIDGNNTGQKLQAQLSPSGDTIQFVGGATTDTSSPYTVNVSGTGLNALGFYQTSLDVDMSTSDKMSNINNGKVNFKIKKGDNYVNFSYDFSATGADKDKTIANIMDDISSRAGVNVKYSQLERKFTIESSSTGSDQNLNVTWDNTDNKDDTDGSIRSNTGTFLNKMFGIDNSISIAKSSSGILNLKQADSAVTFSPPLNIDSTNNTLTINGVDVHLIIKSYDGTSTGQKISDFVADINTKLHGIAGNDAGQKLQAQLSPSGDKIQFVGGVDGSKPYTINVSGTGLSTLGFSQNPLVDMATSDKMSNLNNGKVNFKIKKGDSYVSFAYDLSATGADKDKTIADIMNDISTRAGVDAKYDPVGRKFTIDPISPNQKINIAWDNTGDAAGSNTGAFLNEIFGIDNSPANEYSSIRTGSDASVDITNPNNVKVTVYKQSNVFNIDGVSYSLVKDDSTTATNINVTQNTDKMYNKIIDFKDRYNELIDKINTRLTEKHDNAYPPLTDAQKKSMTSDDIKAWEDKAKKGLVRNDSTIQNLLYSLRSAFFDSVENAGVSLTDIGLSTSYDTTQGGKIVFDIYADQNGDTGQARLKRMLKEHPDQVAKIFSQESTTYKTYNVDLTTDQKKVRYNEEGIAERMKDIFNDYVRTNKDQAGNRGTFVYKAGIKGTTSEIDNMFYYDLQKRDAAITDMTKKLADEENAYYTKYSKLEEAMNTLNSQQSWLSQQLGS